MLSKRRWPCLALLFASFLPCCVRENANAQVSPAEITNPRLKAAETAYFSQILALYRAVPGIRTPFSFDLSRYVGLDPRQEAGTDSRGIEFVNFRNRLLLKISGNYNAAYNPELLTQNERAAHVLFEVISPIVALLTKEFPQDVACDGIGFEISYHVHIHRNFDYEGKEILVVVFDPADAFAFASANDDAGRQEILNRSEIYVNGKEFGLALNQQNPFDLEALGKEPSAPAERSAASPRHAATGGKEPPLNPAVLRTGIAAGSKPVNSRLSGVRTSAGEHVMPATPATPAVEADNRSTATTEDADRLQSQFQAQLDALASAGKANWHFVDYAPPSFGLYQNEIVLQLTLRNTLQFSQDSGSIYKRAAQSFDLFLARELKDILEKVPTDAPFDGYDITVLNQLGSAPPASSEAVEYISSRKTLRQFANAEVTGQQLIDQSVVLVNGVRIALNLQLVE
jgi:hypothetical protein